MAKEKIINNKLVGMKEICRHIGISESTALTWHRDRALPIKKINGIWIATRTAIDKWFEATLDA